MKESNIIFESGKFWVYRTQESYDVMQNKGTYSVLDSAYPKNADGLSIAKARAKYLARRAGGAV